MALQKADTLTRLAPQIDKIIYHIQKHGLNVEHLFTASVSESQKKDLLSRLIEKKEDLDLNGYDIHVVASVFKWVLKKCFRFTSDQDQDFLLTKFYELVDDQDTLGQVLKEQFITLKIPTQKRLLLIKVIQLIHQIKGNKEVNKARSDTLVKMFTPTIFQTNSVLHNAVAMDLMHFLINNPSILENDEIAPSFSSFGSDNNNMPSNSDKFLQDHEEMKKKIASMETKMEMLLKAMTDLSGKMNQK